MWRQRTIILEYCFHHFRLDPDMSLVLFSHAVVVSLGRFFLTYRRALCSQSFTTTLVPTTAHFCLPQLGSCCYQGRQYSGRAVGIQHALFVVALLYLALSRSRHTSTRFR